MTGAAREGRPFPFHRMGQQCWLEEHRRQSHLTRTGDRWPETGNAPNGLIEGRLRPNKSEHGLRSITARHSTLRKCNGTSRRGTTPWRLLHVVSLREKSYWLIAQSYSSSASDGPLREMQG